ncbi:MAG: hypothetical protein AMJ79_12595, partial [Phycisphaerae bacterium SM23_30]
MFLVIVWFEVSVEEFVSEGGAAAEAAVAGVGIEADLDVEVFAGGFDGFDELEGVVGVDVVIDHAVEDEHVSLEAIDIVHGGAEFVTFGVGLGGAHVSFGVDGVVVAPVGDAGRVAGDLEGVGVFHDAHGGGVSAVGGAGDSDAGAVEVGFFAEMADGVGVVMDFDGAEALVGGAEEFLSAAAAAAMVALGDEVSAVGFGAGRGDVAEAKFGGAGAAVEAV